MKMAADLQRSQTPRARTGLPVKREREREKKREKKEKGKEKGGGEKKVRGKKKRRRRRNRKREDGGEKGRRNPQTEKKEKMVAVELLCYVLDIYIYMSYVCVSKEEIVASGNAAKKKKGTDQRRYFERPLANPQWSTC